MNNIVMKPILSIVIQSFERPDLLNGCIALLHENMLDDLVMPYEVIIADDGSSDKTLDFVRTLPHDKLFVNTQKADGKGPGYTLNEANRMAEGKYIMHIEDDFWLVHKFEQVELEALMKALDTIDNVELIRLRMILCDNAELYRIKEYVNMSEPVTHKIVHGGKTYNLRIFKRYMSKYKGKTGKDGPGCEQGGPSYQYVGNPHLRKRSMLDTIGPYPEDISIWGLENTYTKTFRESPYRSGRLMRGWFLHVGGKQTTKGKENTFMGKDEEI